MPHTPKLTSLKNQLKVIQAPMTGTKAVTVLVLVKAGSRHEKESTAGKAHFLEHMCFKGTKRRPNSLNLSKEIDGLGADFNAFTGKDHTGYWIKINAKHLDKALDFLSDIVFNSKIDKTEMERERKTIIEELNMYEDSPSIKTSIDLESIIFKGNSLAFDEGGSKESVKRISRQNLIDFRKKYYSPQNMLLVIAGETKANDLTKLVSRHFSGHKARDTKLKTEKFNNKQNKSRLTCEDKQTNQTHFAIGFPALPYSHPDYEALKLLSIILGGNMSSRLFTKLRERYGLGYYLTSHVNTYMETGSFMVRSGVDSGRLYQALELIIEEFVRLKHKGVGVSELKRAKEYIKGKMFLAMEDSGTVADWYAKHWLLTKKIKTAEQKIKAIENVNLKQVYQVAQKIIKNSKLNLSIIGPKTDQTKIKKILDF